MDQAPQPTIDQVLQRRLALLGQVAEMQQHHAAALAPALDSLAKHEEYLDAHIAEMPIDQVLLRRFELDEAKNQMAVRHKDETEKLAAHLVACEKHIHAHMLESKADQLKYHGLMSFWKDGSYVGMGDWSEFLQGLVCEVPAPEGCTPDQWVDILAHIYQHGNWGLLKRDVSKTAVEEYVDVHKAPPAGVKRDTFRKVHFKRSR